MMIIYIFMINLKCYNSKIKNFKILYKMNQIKISFKLKNNKYKISKIIK